jgi:hypothetical protein
MMAREAELCSPLGEEPSEYGRMKSAEELE